MKRINKYIIEKFKISKDINFTEDDKLSIKEIKSIVFGALANKIGNSNFSMHHDSNRLHIHLSNRNLRTRQDYMFSISKYITQVLNKELKDKLKDNDIYTRDPKLDTRGIIILYFNPDIINVNDD